MRNGKIIELSTELNDEQRVLVENMITQSCENDRLPCNKAWIIAQTLDVPMAAVGRVADQLRIRISRCQLGCF
ncbi:MAG: hypothetical protein OEV64_08620 [Desulfobulbaceae bacterium]|nr:hypothetical protein [Desulfobulbaceae bacterium]